MRALFFKALVAASVTVGCLFATACSGDLASINFSGDFEFVTEDNEAACDFMPDGMFKGGMFRQLISISQTGDQVWSSGIDQWGNSYNMWGYQRGGRFSGLWELDTPNSFQESRHMEFSSFGNYNARLGSIDGFMVVSYDSGFDCIGTQFPFWMLMSGFAPLEDIPPELGDITQEDAAIVRACPGLDVVFAMDTSGSMSDESQALCDAISAVESALITLGMPQSQLRVTLKGITGGPTYSGGFACLQDSVANTYGTTIPGSPQSNHQTLDDSEDWGPVVGVIAVNRQWLANTVRVVVAISDEAPEDGGGSVNSDDIDSIDNAIAVANQNNVTVSVIVASGAGSDILAEAQRIAAATGGTAVESNDPSLDLAALVLRALIEACRPS